MKTHKLIIFAATALFASSLPNSAFAAEAKSEPIASIRPVGKVKPADLPALAKVSFEAALKAAVSAVPGQVIKAELEVEDGNLMYSFEIVDKEHHVTEVEIDAGNGKVLDIDRDEEGK